MWIKTALIFALYFFSYAMIISNAYSGLALLGWYFLLGFSMGLVGFNFCHDVIHGAFFASPKLNRIFSYVFDFNGESSYIWRVSHNLLHHTYTNIPGHDEDINKMIIMRFSPTDDHYAFHRYQHLYALPLYAFTSFNWALFSDYRWFVGEMKKGTIPKREVALFFLFKALNLFAFLFLPMMVLSAPIWQVMLGFLFMHFGGGLTIALIFQLAHLVEGVEFPIPNEAGKIQKCWAEHELRTTSDFATDSPLLTHLIGALNFQVEHHLFTHVCHVHYPAIRPILVQTAQEFGIPYHEHKTFTGAIVSHFKTLKRLGNPP
ncbi:MAG: fatty acid desaturase family protein [Parachlamydiaceae bacterium]